MEHSEKYLQAKWVTENPKGYDERDVIRANNYCEAYLEGYNQTLSIANVVKSLPIQDLPKCNRVEVIDQQGRTYVNRNPANKVSLSVQDEGRTLKVFID